MAKKLDILFSEADSFFADKEISQMRIYWEHILGWHRAMTILLRAK